jgi:hypothetical protein
MELASSCDMSSSTICSDRRPDVSYPVERVIVCGGTPDTAADTMQCSPLALIYILREHEGKLILRP